MGTGLVPARRAGPRGERVEVQRRNGRPVLIWWEGFPTSGPATARQGLRHRYRQIHNQGRQWVRRHRPARVPDHQPRDRIRGDPFHRLPRPVARSAAPGRHRCSTRWSRRSTSRPAWCSTSGTASTTSACVSRTRSRRRGTATSTTTSTSTRPTSAQRAHHGVGTQHVGRLQARPVHRPGPWRLGGKR